MHLQFIYLFLFSLENISTAINTTVQQPTYTQKNYHWVTIFKSQKKKIKISD